MKLIHMDSKEAAEYIGVHVNTLRIYVHDEGLPVLKFPGRRKWVFRKDLIDGWFAERAQPQLMINNKEVKQDDYGKLRVLMP